MTVRKEPVLWKNIKAGEVTVEATWRDFFDGLMDRMPWRKSTLAPSAAKALTDIKGESHPMRAAGKDHLRRNYEDALCIPVLTGTG